MKKLTNAWVVLLLVLALFSFAACDNNQGEEEQTKEVVLLILDKDLNELGRYERELSGNLSDLLFLITQEENSTFSYTSSTSFYGQYVNSVTIESGVGLFPNSDNYEFIAMYHTIDTAEQRDYTIDVLQYDDTDFYAAANGLDATPLVDGAKYLITISTWA